MRSVSARVAWHTHRGRRETNEDAALIHELDDDRLLVAVADGMGGQAGGAEASRLALDALRRSMENGEGLSDAVRAANADVYERAAARPARNGMGTTLVALLVAPDEYWVANVGDSRAYRVDTDEVRQITDDHSFAAEALARGRLSEEELEDSPWKNALTRAIGTDPQVEADLFGPFSTDPEHSVILCTDGLYRVIGPDRILEAFRASADFERMPKKLTDEAFGAGASDNITVAMVAMRSEESTVPGGVQRRAPASDSDASEPSHAPASVGGPSTGSATRRVRRRRLRLPLKRKHKVELVGVTLTLLLAAVAAYVILSVI